MINIIVAMDKNNGIGKDNKLLTHIAPDLKYFKEVTNNHVVIMGYNTYMSLPIRPLPNRLNIVITSKHVNDENLKGSVVVNSVEESIKKALEYKEKEVFVCGGESIYRQFMPIADKLYVTHIMDNFSADTFFPEIDDTWIIDGYNGKKENIMHKHPHVFGIYKRA